MLRIFAKKLLVILGVQKKVQKISVKKVKKCEKRVLYFREKIEPN